MCSVILSHGAHHRLRRPFPACITMTADLTLTLTMVISAAQICGATRMSSCAGLQPSLAHGFVEVSFMVPLPEHRLSPPVPELEFFCLHLHTFFVFSLSGFVCSFVCEIVYMLCIQA